MKSTGIIKSPITSNLPWELALRERAVSIRSGAIVSTAGVPALSLLSF